ncbi:hypothetical protein TNCT_339391 [Trichonephila clavata]|uniref:Uncharacterized protein n=1 Tax=Trichonephila clavata TaxID=2740835 RepID=A0A8X6G981_TRICU|nr:hypothetical protein TNCT_339391 [Trichonephila clavata]
MEFHSCCPPVVREKESTTDSSSFKHVLPEHSVVCSMKSMLLWRSVLLVKENIATGHIDRCWNCAKLMLESSDLLMLMSTSGFLASLMGNNMVSLRLRTFFFGTFLIILSIEHVL